MASTQDAEIFVARQYAKPIDEKAFRCEIEMIEAIILNQVSSYDHAVRAFASDTENSARYKIQINLWATWRLILDTAKTFSQTHAGLIKLVVGLQQLPDVIVQVNGQHQVFQPMENEVLWRDLPLLQASLREEVYNYGQ